jgi:hypothetical protein
MKKKLTKKLSLNKKTVAILNRNDLNHVRGKNIAPPEKTQEYQCTVSCTCAMPSNCFC